jgi:PIN domain nuclease of toxin-antitoxin system
MKILLDTHAFLWLATIAPELSEKAKTLFQTPEMMFI